MGEGIIFLTTNVVKNIDPAVISRAQIHIQFPSLTESSRLQVWGNFLRRLPEDAGTIPPDDVRELARWKINGREIKNILNMSVSWCRRKEVKLTLAVIENLLQTICTSAMKEEEPANAKTNGHSDEFSLLDI